MSRSTPIMRLVYNSNIQTSKHPNGNKYRNSASSRRLAMAQPHRCHWFQPDSILVRHNEVSTNLKRYIHRCLVQIQDLYKTFITPAFPPESPIQGSIGRKAFMAWSRKERQEWKRKKSPAFQCVMPRRLNPWQDMDEAGSSRIQRYRPGAWYMMQSVM